MNRQTLCSDGVAVSTGVKCHTTLVGALLAILLPTIASASVLVDEPFNDGNRFASEVDPLGLNWWMTEQGTASVVADSSIGPNALYYRTGNEARAIVGLFEGVMLGPGGSDTSCLRLSFDVAMPTSPTASHLLRFGLYKSNGTSMNADDDQAYRDDTGYFASIGWGDESLSALWKQHTAANWLMRSNSDGQESTILSSVDRALSDTDMHHVVLEITRYDLTPIPTVKLRMSVDDQLWGQGEYTGPLLTFDEIALTTTTVYSGYDAYYDNIRLELVPEPAVGTLLLAASGLLTIRRPPKR